jgi:hypothetical protein
VDLILELPATGTGAWLGKQGAVHWLAIGLVTDKGIDLAQWSLAIRGQVFPGLE